MRALLLASLCTVSIVFIADRAEPGYGKFAFWRGVGQPISKVLDGPNDCSRALSAAEFKTLKTMKGATQKELSAMFAGAMCETGLVKLDFSPKKVKPEMKDGKLDKLKVI
jgi:hypothetical protein